ncbi:MAG: hypothetical protein ACREMQ_03380, partial [Longimicrobiales bacterium]
YGVGGTVVGGAILLGGAWAGVLSGGLLSQTGNFVNLFVNTRTRLKLKAQDGQVLKLKNPDLQSMGMAPRTEAGEDWRVVIGRKNKQRVFTGPEAERVAGLIVPKLNSMGGSATKVQEAVKQLETLGGPEAFLRSSLLDPYEGPGPDLARKRGRGNLHWRGPHGERYLRVAKLPTHTRLAVEMALHEEQERRALEGELKALEEAWRQAEDIAAIADNLLLPADAETFLDRHRSPSDAGSGA